VAAALARYRPEVVPGPQYQSGRAGLGGHDRTTIFHPVGTAKMGTHDDRMAVVDSELRVIGIEDCVADASIMPMIVGSNSRH
jgi:choline dehydrogenase-like flavoprotein